MIGRRSTKIDLLVRQLSGTRDEYFLILQVRNRRSRRSRPIGPMSLGSALLVQTEYFTRRYVDEFIEDCGFRPPR